MKKIDKILVYVVTTQLAATILLLAVIHASGDAWWPGALLLFGPRWMAGLPLVPLLPLVLWRRPRLLAPLVLSGAVVFGPLMGLRWSFSSPAPPSGMVLRILTCNVRTGQFNTQALSELIRVSSVDIVALQECPPSVQLDLPTGWRKTQAGILAIMSRFPIEAKPPILTKHPPHVWPRPSVLPCAVSTPQGEVIFHSVYLPSPRYGLQHLLDRRIGINPQKADLLISETANRRNAARNARNALQVNDHPFILAGDFNMPVESTIYREVWADLQNAFSAKGRGYGWSFRDKALFVPIQARIDHILTGNGVIPLTCEVGPEVGSDHLPVIADVLIPTNVHHY